MKTYRHLWDSFISRDNWIKARDMAKKGKSTWPSVIRFNDTRLDKLRDEVILGTYRTSEYAKMTIYEPKERIIYKLPFRDRVVHHAVMNILKPILIPLLTDTCYACVEGRGPHRAGLKCAYFTRKYDYCLKCDIKKFYPSIHHGILLQLLGRIIKDEKFMGVLTEIVESIEGDVNVPIGNYTSQWLGNYYLVPLDNYIKHVLHTGSYVRYCDDFMLFSNDKKALNDAKSLLQLFLSSRLHLSFSKAEVFNTKQGVDFVGYRYFKDHVIMRKSSARKWLRRKPKREAIPSFYGQSKWCMSYNLRKAYLRKVPLEWGREIRLLLKGSRGIGTEVM